MTRPDDAALARYYDGVAERYETDVFAKVQRYGARVADFLRAVAARPGARVLDVGCGPGHLTRDLPSEVDVVGVDLSPEMIRVAARGRPRGSYRVHDFHAPLPAGLGSFDVVLAVGCLEFCRDVDAVVAHLAAVARAGARLLLGVVARDAGDAAAVPISPKLPDVAMYRYTRAEVEAALARAGLQVVAYERHPGWLNAGVLVDYHLWDAARR